MKKLPIGIQDFRKLRENGYIYVDKTEMIYDLVTGGNYYFLSRPRRFGKSLLVSVIKEIFLGSEEPFEGLWIKDKWDWKQEHPIIHLPFASLNYQGVGLEQALINHLRELALSYSIGLKNQDLKDRFKELIITLNKQYGQVVLLVDEYDKPIIDYLGPELEQAKENQQIMRTFYSVIKDADPYIRFCFLTGVSKFSKVSIFSDLNNLDDITLDPNYSTLLGITQAELNQNFADNIQLLAKKTGSSIADIIPEIKRRYNGYDWDGLGNEKVYNPFSTLKLFKSNRFMNYWFSTATPTFLINLLKDAELYDVNGVVVGDTVFESYTIDDNFDLISLLFQTGYLTISHYDPQTRLYTLSYPNMEVKSAFTEHLLSKFANLQNQSSYAIVVAISQAFKANDIDLLIKNTNRLLKNLPYQLHEKTEKFYHAVVHLIYTLLGVQIQSEVCTSDGRADAIVQTDTHIYCLEFKIDQSAEIALQQIKDKGYLDKYAGNKKQLVAVGVNFSTEEKKINEFAVETA